MLAAVVPVGDKGWFFKLSGSQPDVKAQEEQFQTLLKSLRVQGDRLTWKTPDGWNERAETGMRVATFTMGDDRLECSVIPLPAPDGADSDEYLLANVNRWRGQLGLSPWSAQQVAADGGSSELHRFKLEDGTPVAWVAFDGSMKSSGGPPFAGGGPFSGGGTPGDMNRPSGSTPAGPPGPVGPPGPAGPSRPAVSAAPATDDPGKPEELDYTVPAGWVPEKGKALRLVSWKITDGDRTAEAYISQLGAAGSAVGPNVNRWRDQAGLPPLEGQALTDALEPMQIGGLPGTFSRSDGAKNSVYGAIVVQGGVGWFFKLQGDPQLVSREEPRLRSFLKSVKFQ